MIYVQTTKLVFHQMGPLVMGRREHWRGKCDHYFIPYYLDKKYGCEDTVVLSTIAALSRFCKEITYVLPRPGF